MAIELGERHDRRTQCVHGKPPTVSTQPARLRRRPHVSGQLLDIRVFQYHDYDPPRVVPVVRGRVVTRSELSQSRARRPATYASVLLRAHLRQLTPLPKDELLALKRSIAELGAIGRNINQIARAVSGGGELPGSMRVEFSAMLKICEAMRDHTKALLKANLASWAAGHTGVNR